MIFDLVYLVLKLAWKSYYMHFCGVSIQKFTATHYDAGPPAVEYTRTNMTCSISLPKYGSVVLVDG